jgi:hypothetical protein
VLANLSEDVTLETKTLRVEARVAEIEYGAGDMPPNSFFGKLTVDLAVWVLPEQAAVTSGAGFGMPARASVM